MKHAFLFAALSVFSIPLLPGGWTTLALETELEAKVERRLKGVLGADAKMGIAVQLQTTGAGPTVEVTGANVILQVAEGTSEESITSAKGIITDSFNRFQPQVVVK